MRKMARQTRLSFAAIAAFSFTIYACGGGRNLNAFLYGDDPNDAGTGGDDGIGGEGGAGIGGEGGAGMGGEGGEGGRDPSTGPGGIQDCFTCAASNCPEAVECFTDPDCQAGIGCAVSECFGGGGGPDPQCFLECFDGDTDAAFTAFQAITCVFQSCGDECGSLLGGGFP